VKRKPAWPVLAAYGVAFATCLVASQELVLAVARVRSAGDATRLVSEASRFALSAQGLCAVAVLDALVLATAAVVTARLLEPRERGATQLGLGPSRASAVGLAASVAAVMGLSLAGGTLADLLVGGRGPVSHAIEDALMAPTGAGGLAGATIALAVAPAITEETFFRGVMLPRLATAWGRWPAIVVSAIAFGALHLDLVQGTVAALIGVLLGWIASRFDSVRPAMIAHALNNALFVALAHEGLSTAARGGALAALVLGALAAAGSIAVLRSRRAIRASTPAS
jgi:membrane protease YdiL (CAAX protease family)